MRRELCYAVVSIRLAEFKKRVLNRVQNRLIVEKTWLPKEVVPPHGLQEEVRCYSSVLADLAHAALAATLLLLT